MDWLIWFLLPCPLDHVYSRNRRQERLDGTRNVDSVYDGAVFLWLVRLATTALAVCLTGATTHSVALSAIAFVAVLVVWTVLPGISSVRAWGATTDDRWERRRPLLNARRARGGRGRGCR